jgi:hypothetical protein
MGALAAAAGREVVATVCVLGSVVVSPHGRNAAIATMIASATAVESKERSSLMSAGYLLLMKPSRTSCSVEDVSL